MSGHAESRRANEGARVTFRQLIDPGLKGLARYWRPFLFLQTCALGLVIAFYKCEPVRVACGHLSDLKQAWGIGFAAVAGAIAGVVLPEIAKAVVPGSHRSRRPTWGDLLFTVLVFGGIGIITDYQYRFFAYLLGSDAAFSTAVKKMLVDQFITTPIYGIPYFSVLFLWRENGFRIGDTLRMLTPHWYLTHVVTLLLPCWAFWCPMVLMIYSLPSMLQLSLFTLALATWSLILVFVATGEHEREPTESSAVTVEPK